MIRQHGHRNGCVHDSLRNHKRGQALAKWIVVFARMPDRNFFGFPGFHRTHSDRLRRHQRDVTAAGGARVLGDCQWMKIDDACGELPILRGRRRCGPVFALARQRIVESPMLHVPLPSLHDGAANACFPALAIGLRVRLGKMQVRVRHPQFLANPLEA